MPITTLVRDSVESVSEARLSLNEQADVIRSSMNGLSTELNQSVQSLEPVLKRIEGLSNSIYTNAEELDQLQALRELRVSIETLNSNVKNLAKVKRSWPWNKGDN